ncbi:hypothetical protein AAG570_003581 [Ranatra chinensis]|uniref:Uncharacterized protein n=1 Tax=Ranatra chinensis TaxID=642074 RepID=A0ABD0Y423_9HEMI
MLTRIGGLRENKTTPSKSFLNSLAPRQNSGGSAHGLVVQFGLSAKMLQSLNTLAGKISPGHTAPCVVGQPTDNNANKVMLSNNNNNNSTNNNNNSYGNKPQPADK